MKKLVLWSAATALLVSLIMLCSPLTVHDAATYTYAVLEKAQTFTQNIGFGGNITLSTANATVDGKNLDLVPANTRIVHICDSGCEYTGLNAACAGETSTAASPIIYNVHAGVYTEQVSCSGEVSATFRGAGGKASKLTFTGAVGEDGTFKPGNCKDCVVEGLYIVGHRALFWNPADVVGGSGTFTVRNNIFETETNGNDEDCIFGYNFGANTVAYFHDNYCTTDADGFTFNDDGANLTLISKDNFITCHNNVASAGAGMYRFGSTLAFAYIEGDTWDCTMTDPSGNLVVQGLNFINGDPGGASSGVAIATGIQGRIRNMTSGFGGSTVVGFNIESTATNLTTLRIETCDIQVVANDATNTLAYGVRLDNNTTDVSVIGSRFRSSGGLANNDLSGGSSKAISVLATNYETEDGSRTAAAALDQKKMLVGGAVNMNGGVTMSPAAGVTNLTLNTVGGGEVGLALDNTQAAASNASPYITLQNSNNYRWLLQIGGDDDFNLYDSAFNTIIDWRDGFAGADLFTDTLSIERAGAALSVGDGGASDSNRVCFDAGTTDACFTWDDTNNILWYQGPTDSTGSFAIDDNMGLRLYEEDGGGTNYIELKGGATLAANVSGLPVTGSAVDTHGVVLWGDSSDAFDTGTEVCAARGLTCVDVKTLAGVDSTCATDQGAATTHYYALCK